MSRPSGDQDADEKCDCYSILSIPMTSTVQEISKVYRRLARKHHPDRNPDDPKAASKFQLLKRASEILLDDQRRVSYDTKLRAKLLRQSKDLEADAQIRQMKLNLFAREKLAKEELMMRNGQYPQHDIVLNTIRSENQKIKSIHKQKHLDKISRINSNKPKSYPTAMVKGHTNVLVRWAKHRCYSVEELQTLFGQYGRVDLVVISSNKRSAIVLFQDQDEAIEAVEKLSIYLSQDEIDEKPSPKLAFKTLKLNAETSLSNDDKILMADEDQHQDHPSADGQEYLSHSHMGDELTDDFEEMVLKKMQEAGTKKMKIQGDQ